jgi:hypothetical protein
VPGPFAADPHLGGGADEVTSRVDDLGVGDRRSVAAIEEPPAAEEGAIADLGDGLEGEEGRSADEKGVVPLGKRGSGSEAAL